MSDKSSNKSNEATLRKRWRGLKAAMVTMVCAALILGMFSPAFADDAYNRAEKALGMIFPDASFAKCEKSEYLAKCDANKASFIQALTLFEDIRKMHLSVKTLLQRDDVNNFFDTDFYEIAFCFRDDCNFGIKLADTKSKEAFEIWVSLGRYMSCRHMLYYFFENTSLRFDLSNNNKALHHYRVESEARARCGIVDLHSSVFNYTSQSTEKFKYGGHGARY